MDDPDHDQQMRRLQRIAYGAVASDAERSAALAELEAVRRPPAGTDRGMTGPIATGPIATARAATGPIATARVATGSIAVAHQPPQPAAARSLKWAIAVGAAALVVGVAVGWQAAFRTTVSEPTAADVALGGAASMTLGIGDLASVPVVGSTASDVFDRPQAATDVPALDVTADWYDPATLRLLATTPDGVAVYAAKASADPANDVCVVIAHPKGALGGSCTAGGMFDGGGLQSSLHVEGAGFSATWRADGSVQVSVPQG